MNKKTIIIAIAIIAVVSATTVGAINVINHDPDMKEATFDQIKLAVPTDAEFTQTIQGFEDNKYGITISTFKDKESMVSYLDNKTDVQMISVANLPPESVAFKNQNTTSILVANTDGNEGICISSLDENLTTKMANSVVFEDGHKSIRDTGILGLGLFKKHMTLNKDYKFILPIIIQVQEKNNKFSLEQFSSIINNILNIENGDTNNIDINVDNNPGDTNNDQNTDPGVVEDTNNTTDVPPEENITEDDISQVEEPSEETVTENIEGSGEPDLSVSSPDPAPQTNSFDQYGNMYYY